MEKLSMLIPARNEIWLQKTIECVLAAAVEDIEVIAVLDGYWPDPPVKDDPRVIVIHHTEAIGQRAAINEAARVASGKYIMKLDAHCNVAPGFDKVLKEDCKYEWTMVPRMFNLDIETFQPQYIDSVRKGFAKAKIHDYMYISGPEHDEWPLRAMYFGKYAGVSHRRPEENDNLVDETMGCMGPGWFMHKDRFWELGGCDENHGGWGQQGVEVSLKAWLSGGALMVNKKTWFSHWFRSGEGFPYPIKKSDTQKAKDYSRDLWFNGKWEKQVRSVEWLAEKFNAPTWEPALKLSVIIPSFRDPSLHKTIEDILTNFRTDFEIIPVIDGYELKEPLVEHERVRPIYNEQNMGMREAINIGVRAARGKYIMRTDEHCKFCEGFDEIMLADIQDNWIVDARRYFLDPTDWSVMERDPIDYEKLIIKHMPLNAKKFASVEWVTRTKERRDVILDENMCLQGSVWVMPKKWWETVIGNLQTEGYGPLYQDTIEMLFKTWAAGGKLMVNKGAWYAHRHRSFGRAHSYTYKQATPGWHYALLKHYEAYLGVKEAWAI